ncbi:hypothetical protein MBLNU13_g05311t2 [Cladosporium sp. NU13]
MTKRKADGDPGKRKPKKPAASGRQNPKPESPAARTYRHRRAARSARIPSDTSATDPEAYGVYAFSSSPSSTRQTPPGVPKVDNTVLAGDDDKRNDTQSVNSTSTVSSLILDEDTLLRILCFHCDDGLTEDAFDAIVQHAAAAVKTGDEFGIIFLKRFISKLADMPINQDWLAEIIDRLQQNLDSLCDRVRGQIQSLGKLPLPDRERLEPPVGSDEEEPRDDGVLKDVAEEIQSNSMGKSTDNREDMRHQDSSVVTVRSKCCERKTKDTRRDSQPASMHSGTKQELTASDDKPQLPKPNNAPLNLQQRKAPMDSVYELFVRCVNEANCSATQQNGKAIKAFNKRVRRAWARIDSEPKAAWVKLFNARPDDVSLIIKGKKLLWSQGLHLKLFPSGCGPKLKHTD